MLKQRVITGVCLAALLLWAIFFWPHNYFAGLLGLMALIAGWEWSRMCGLRSTVQRAAYALIGGATSMIPITTPMLEWPVLFLIAPEFLFWFIATLILMRGRTPKKLGDNVSIARVLIAVPVFAGVLWSMVWLRESNVGSPLLLLYVFAIVWCADIGAYFAGRRWGKRKLSPNISPGKSVEGAVGGLLAVTIWALIFIWAEPFSFGAGLLLIATLVAGFFSIYGDLLESYMKRSVGIKDSGSILPGHGGLLDRIDSVLAAMPVFVFCVAVGD
ncbi:MAG: phosphatidate cytidylyltransferase [Pseudomonadota bacterium]